MTLSKGEGQRGQWALSIGHMEGRSRRSESRVGPGLRQGLCRGKIGSYLVTGSFLLRTHSRARLRSRAHHLRDPLGKSNCIWHWPVCGQPSSSSVNFGSFSVTREISGHQDSGLLCAHPFPCVFSKHCYTTLDCHTGSALCLCQLHTPLCQPWLLCTQWSPASSPTWPGGDAGIGPVGTLVCHLSVSSAMGHIIVLRLSLLFETGSHCIIQPRLAAAL